MLEIQISLDKKKFLFFYTYIKEYFLKNDIYPIFFILKKMHPNKKNYFSNFPKNNLSISLGFRKKDYLNRGKIFKRFFMFLKRNNFDVYITKNEIFNNLIMGNKILKKIKENKNKSKMRISNIFFEKI